MQMCRLVGWGVEESSQLVVVEVAWRIKRIRKVKQNQIEKKNIESKNDSSENEGTSK